MKRLTPEQVDDFRAIYLDHSWRCPGSYPVMSWEQTEELLSLAVPWVLDEFTPKRAPVSRPAKPKIPKSKPDRGSQSEGRRLVYSRSGQVCEVMVDEETCRGRASEWQHRKNRSQQGTWHASNGLHACSPCHAWIHANPHAALQNGWTVPSFADPTERPVLRRGVWVLLADDGSVEPVDGAALSGVEGKTA